MNRFILIDTVKEAFKEPRSPAKLTFAIAKGVLYLAQFGAMSGTEKKEELLSVIKMVAEQTANPEVVKFAEEHASTLIDNLVLLGKSDLWRKCGGCCKR